MTKYSIGQKVMHPLHGIGTVESIEEKHVLGKTSRFSEIYFSSERLKLMVNLDSESNMIRSLISKDEIPNILKVMKNSNNDLSIRASERFNINMKKIKSADIYMMAEVVKDLSDLKKCKKLSCKEETMLKQTKKILSSELSYVSDMPQEEAEGMIEQMVKTE
ncbi:MAG: hypothetical protein LWY06_12545 [Firmicutes bacterium]|nr:hypothetical protein [Bacillota bacterium]